MSSEQVNETKEAEEHKIIPLPSALKTKSKDAANEETNRSKRVVFQEKTVIINKTIPKNTENAKSDVVEYDKQRDKKDRVRPPTKVVVRRLPPTMTLDVFVDYVSPLPEHDFIYFVPADMSLGSNAFSRVYINFVNMADLITFHEQFDSYVFMDNKGNEYPAVVEFAQFQRIPKRRQVKKRDLKAGTLKDDPEYIAFLETLREKKEASSAKQTLDVVIPLDKPGNKITTTPLLEYIKQRRAEQQKLRDEKREERRRKELERKRIKDEEKKRRKDGDSVPKVIRSHETEENEDSKSGKDVKEKEWSPLPQVSQSSKRREDDKLKQREEKKRERPTPESRTRDVKNRETGPKSYRDERQKLAEGRIQRKLADDHRKKIINERNQNSNKQGDTHHSQEFEKSVSSKDMHVRKSYSKEMKESDTRKTGSDRHNVEDDKNMKEFENRRSYRDRDGRKHERYTYMKDAEHKRNAYSNDQRKSNSSHAESEPRKRSSQEKEIDSTKQQLDLPSEKVNEHEMKTASNDESVSERVPFSPVNCAELSVSEELTHQQNKKSHLKRSSSVGSHGSTQSEEDRKDHKIIIDIKTKVGQPLKRSSSLDFRNVYANYERKDENILLEDNYKCPESASMGEILPKTFIETNESKNEKVDENTEESGEPLLELSMFLECGNKQQGDNSHTDEETGSDKDKNNKATVEQLEKEENQSKDVDNMGNFNENELFSNESNELKEDQSLSKDKEVKTSESSSSTAIFANMAIGTNESENKRDPRAERRIRNKDRPSIEIYRPGMGRFSMQRKEREKCAATSSSLEQDSPSTSPSPSPSIRPISASRSRAGQELRSMTFKRSVSREK